MIVLDASVLIAQTVRGQVHAARAQELLDSEAEFVAHPMTIAEYLVGPARAGREEEGVRALRRLGVQWLQPASDEPVRLARLRVETRLRLPDCCVLAAALPRRAAVATFDARVASAARGVGLTALGTD